MAELPKQESAHGTDTARPADAAHPLAVTKADIAVLTDEQKQAIAIRKNSNIVTAKLAGTNWGKGMDDETRRAVADWGGRNGIDVTTEIHVLGGNIYLNAQFYQNRLVGLIHRGHVLDYKQELIQDDPRLDTIINEKIPADLPDDLRAIGETARRDAYAEKVRRRRLRIEHGAPETSTVGGPAGFAIGLTTITLAAMPSTPIRGVKWAPHDASDPVGKAYPQETALTRSARRALKQCVTHIPELARWVDGSEEDAAHTVAVAVREYEDRVEAGRRRQLNANNETPGAAPVAEADYVTEARRRAKEPVAAHAEDVTKIRGPVSVTPAPGDDTIPPRPVPGPATAEASGSLELALGPDGATSVDDEIDDMDLLEPEERRAVEERQRREASR